MSYAPLNIFVVNICYMKIGRLYRPVIWIKSNEFISKLLFSDWINGSLVLNVAYTNPETMLP